MYNLLPFTSIVSRVSLELPADEWVRISGTSPRSAISLHNPGPASILLRLAPRGGALPETVEADAIDYLLPPQKTLSVLFSESLDLAAALPAEASPQIICAVELAH